MAKVNYSKGKCQGNLNLIKSLAKVSSKYQIGDQRKYSQISTLFLFRKLNVYISGRNTS